MRDKYFSGFAWLGRVISFFAFVAIFNSQDLDNAIRMLPLVAGTFAPLVFGSQIPQSIHALVSSVLTVALVGGVFRLFEPGLLFDDFLHLLTPIVVALTLTSLLKKRFKKDKLLAFISIVSISITIEALWEIFEGALAFFMNQPHTLEDPFDTVWDLTLAVVGSVIGVLIGII